MHKTVHAIVSHKQIYARPGREKVLLSVKPDVIMRLAAESHVDRSIDESSSFIETNIVGAYVPLEAARSYWNRLEDNEKNPSISFIYLQMKFIV